MKGLKIALITIAVLVVLAVVGIFLVARNLNGIVEAAIEKYGSQATGTPVQVQAVNIELKSGQGSVRGLQVANPPGFSNEPIFRLGDISIAIDTGSLTSGLPVVNDIRISNPSFLYQINQQAGTNLGVIKKNLEQFAASHGAGRKAEPLAKGGGQTRLLVKRLTIEGGKGVLDLTAVGGKREEATLPPLTMTDVGGRNGITPAALGEAVLAALVKNLEQTAARQGVEQAVRGKIQEKGGELEKKLNDKAAEALKKALGQ